MSLNKCREPLQFVVVMVTVYTHISVCATAMQTATGLASLLFEAGSDLCWNSCGQKLKKVG